ncbi:MAG: ACT domain-containing protein [Gemmatimonadota bacterium]
MPDSVRKVYAFSTTVSNRPGEAFRVLSTLVSAGINLLACAGRSTGRRSHIDVVPDDSRKFAAAVKKAHILFDQKKSGFLIQGDDRPGALADHLKLLADHGINVAAVDGLAAGKGRWGAIVWVEPKDATRAGRVLRAPAGDG